MQTLIINRHRPLLDNFLYINKATTKAKDATLLLFPCDRGMVGYAFDMAYMMRRFDRELNLIFLFDGEKYETIKNPFSGRNILFKFSPRIKKKEWENNKNYDPTWLICEEVIPNKKKMSKMAVSSRESAKSKKIKSRNKIEIKLKHNLENKDLLPEITNKIEIRFSYSGPFTFRYNPFYEKNKIVSNKRKHDLNPDSWKVISGPIYWYNRSLILANCLDMAFGKETLDSVLAKAYPINTNTDFNTSIKHKFQRNRLRKEIKNTEGSLYKLVGLYAKGRNVRELSKYPIGECDYRYVNLYLTPTLSGIFFYIKKSKDAPYSERLERLVKKYNRFIVENPDFTKEHDLKTISKDMLIERYRKEKQNKKKASLS